MGIQTITAEPYIARMCQAPCPALYILQSYNNPIFFLMNVFIYFCLRWVFVAVLCVAFSSCGEQGLLFVAVHGLLIAVASLVVEHGL